MIGIILTMIHIAVCFMLIVVILIQGGRGQGLTGPSFVSGNVQSLLGTRAADFLTKATTISAIFFLFTCLGLNILETRKSKSLLAGAGQMAPVDIDAVKKALEKVKAEQAKPATGPTPNKVADAGQDAVTQDVGKGIETAATTAQAAAKSATVDQVPPIESSKS